MSRSCDGSDGGGRLLAEAERGLVAQHPVQADGELARDRHASPCHAPRLGDLQAPSAQARPFARTCQQRMGRLVERVAGQLVAAAADLALDVSLARLAAGRRQTEMRANVPGAPEPLRLIDGGAECQCGDRPDAWYAHQAPADRLAADDDEDMPGQPVELLQHRGQDRQQRRDERQDQGIVPRHLAHPPGKGRAGRRAELDPALTQDRPHHVLDGSHLVEHGAARHQQRAPEPGLARLDVNLSVPARTHDLGERAGIVAVGLVGRATGG